MITDVIIQQFEQMKKQSKLRKASAKCLVTVLILPNVKQPRQDSLQINLIYFPNQVFRYGKIFYQESTEYRTFYNKFIIELSSMTRQMMVFLVSLFILFMGCQAVFMRYLGNDNLILDNQPVDFSQPATKLAQNKFEGSCAPYEDETKLQSGQNPPPDNTTKIVPLPFYPPIIFTYEMYLMIFKPQRLFSRRLLQSEDSTFRRMIFTQQLKLINEHNRNQSRSYNMDLNQFIDYTEEEQKKLFSGFQRIERKLIESRLIVQKSTVKRTGLLPLTDLKSGKNQTLVAPSPYTKPQMWNIDWRKCFGYDPIYNSGECGACSFFSVIETLAITLKIWGYSIPPLSVQAPLSCLKPNPENVCLYGADYLQVYEYLRKYGIGPAEAYPYTDQLSKVNARKCNYQKLKSDYYRRKLLYINEVYVIQENDCKEVDQLRTRALTVAVIANSNFTKYKSGTFDYNPDSQAKENINHAVALVGYDPANGYLIKNVWGRTWGMKGYAYVREESGVCEWAIYGKEFFQMGS